MPKRVPVSGCRLCGHTETDHGTSTGSEYPQYADAPRHTYEPPTPEQRAERR